MLGLCRILRFLSSTIHFSYKKEGINSIIPNTSFHSTTHTLTPSHKELVFHANLVEGVVLVLEAGFEAGVDLQGVVVGRQLQQQGRVTLFLKTPVGIQHLHVWIDKHKQKVQEMLSLWHFKYPLYAGCKREKKMVLFPCNSKKFNKLTDS